MGDPICKWRKVSTENIIEMVSWLPKRVCTESEYKSHMLQLPIGKAFLRTACQLSCQLGLQYVDERKMFHPRFDHDITENEDICNTIFGEQTGNLTNVKNMLCDFSNIIHIGIDFNVSANNQNIPDCHVYNNRNDKQAFFDFFNG